MFISLLELTEMWRRLFKFLNRCKLLISIRFFIRNTKTERNFMVKVYLYNEDIIERFSIETLIKNEILSDYFQ